MNAFVIILFFTGAFLLSWSRRRFLGISLRREAVLAAFILGGICVAVGTPLLSAVHGLNFWGVFSFWIVMSLSTVAGWDRRQLAVSTDVLTRSEKWLLSGWFCLMGALGFLAVYVAPNSWDAMTYHLARVVHWQHQGSLDYYPTNIGRQLWTLPLAEYAMLHLQILTGADVLANSVQWVSWIGCGIGVSVLAGYLGLPRAGQMAVLVLGSTIPMGILESTSAQNDLAAALWIVIFMIMLIKWALNDCRLVYAGWMLLAFVLGVLTKATIILFLPALALLAFFVSTTKKKMVWGFLGVLLLGILLVVGFTGAAHLKKIFTYNASSVGVEVAQVQNKAMSPRLFISNLVRHAAVHFQTPSQRINDVFIRAVKKVHRALGLSMVDPRVSVGDAGFLLAVSAFHEYYAGNFLHFWLGVFCCLFLFFSKKGVYSKLVKLYMAALLIAFLIFVLYMRWQPWISRLQLPFFILGAPVLGVVLYRLDQKWRMLFAAALLFWVAAWPWVLNGKLKPVVGKKSVLWMSRREQYFLNRPYMQLPFVWATDVVRRTECSRVGLSLGVDSWEYPYWVLLSDVRGLDLRHVGVNDISTAYESALWKPCVIIKELNAPSFDDFSYHGINYKHAGYFRPLHIYLPEQSAN